MSGDLSDFLRFLAPLFQAENRQGGTATAKALLAAADQPLPAPSSGSPMPAGLCRDVLSHAPLPELQKFASLLAGLNWHYSGLKDGRIRPEIAHRMFTAQLIGPDGLYYHPDLKVGVFLQEAELDYVTRSHAAEECFHMLAGKAHWSTHDGPATAKGAGDAIFHASNVPHRSETRKQPMLAAWRWTGDIGWDSYQLKG